MVFSSLTTAETIYVPSLESSRSTSATVSLHSPASATAARTSGASPWYRSASRASPATSPRSHREKQGETPAYTVPRLYGKCPPGFESFEVHDLEDDEGEPVDMN
jgi:hypothetical protein